MHASAPVTIACSGVVGAVAARASWSVPGQSFAPIRGANVRSAASVVPPRGHSQVDGRAREYSVAYRRPGQRSTVLHSGPWPLPVRSAAPYRWV